MREAKEYLEAGRPRAGSLLQARRLGRSRAPPITLAGSGTGSGRRWEWLGGSLLRRCCWLELRLERRDVEVRWVGAGGDGNVGPRSDARNHAECRKAVTASERPVSSGSAEDD